MNYIPDNTAPAKEDINFLYENEGFSIEELAGIFGIPQDVIKERLDVSGIREMNVLEKLEYLEKKVTKINLKLNLV